MILIVMALSVIGALLAIGIAWMRFFSQNPLQASLRAFIAILALLAGNAILPTFDVAATLSVNLAPIFFLQSEGIRLTSGSDINWIVGFCGIGVLAAICLMRVPVPSTR
jgi:hypothetical protein